MKRNQIQIAIDALKKQRGKYSVERNKALVTEQEARESAQFFNNEMKRLDEQIKQLEKPAEPTEADKVLKALEG